MVFVTKKGICSSSGEIKKIEFKNWFSFDDFEQELDKNSEKRMILVEKFVQNR